MDRSKRVDANLAAVQRVAKVEMDLVMEVLEGPTAAPAHREALDVTGTKVRGGLMGVTKARRPTNGWDRVIATDADRSRDLGLKVIDRARRRSCRRHRRMNRNRGTQKSTTAKTSRPPVFATVQRYPVRHSATPI